MSCAFASGLGAVRRWLRSGQPTRRDLRNDAIAGLPGAIGNIPDGMAAAALAGVSPPTACAPRSPDRSSAG